MRGGRGVGWRGGVVRSQRNRRGCLCTCPQVVPLVPLHQPHLPSPLFPPLPPPLPFITDGEGGGGEEVETAVGGEGEGTREIIVLSDKEEGGGGVEGADEIGLEVTGEGRLEGGGEGGGETGGLMGGGEQEERDKKKGKNARKKDERKKEKERKKERIKKKKCDEFCFLDLCCMHDHSKNQVRKNYQSLEQKERRGRKLRKILKLLKMEEEDCYQEMKKWRKKNKKIWGKKAGMFRVPRLSAKQAWDLMLMSGMSDDKWKVFRERVRDLWGDNGVRLFPSLNSIISERDKEKEFIMKKLRVRETKDKQGAFCLIEDAMKLVVELYGLDDKQSGKEESVNCKWKVSVDGKVYGRQKKKMVLVGITPLGLTSKISEQSCFSVFPLAMICGTEDPEELEEQLKDLWEEMKNFKKEESTCVEWEVKVERDGKDIRLGNTLDDRVRNELYNWGIECGGEEGNGNLGESGGEEIEGEVWKKIRVTFDWLCVADLAACWKIYLFGGFRDGNNCPFCDVDGPDERGKVFDSCWGTWKEGYSKEGLESVMGLSLSDFCICSLHMMLRVVNYLVSRLCLLCMDGRKDTLVQELAGLLEKVGAGWRMYEDKDGGGATT